MESLKKIYPNVVVPQHERGYFGIGIHCPKVTKNIGTLWRTAHILGADFMFIIGKRYENMRTDTRKSWRHVPLLWETVIEFRELWIWILKNSGKK